MNNQTENTLNEKEIEGILTDIANHQNYQKVAEELIIFDNYIIQGDTIFFTWEGEEKDEMEFEYFEEIVAKVMKENEVDYFEYLK